MTATDSRTLRLNGDEVFVRTFGDADRPPLVLLHGLYGDAASMAPIAQMLAEKFRVIAPDALGHGRSTRRAGFTLADQGRMVDALVPASGYPSAAVLGVSMGSYLAAQAAILAPDRFTHLVLAVGKAHGTTSSSVAYATRMGFDLAGATMEETLQFLAGALWSRDTSPERRSELANRMAQLPEVVTLNPQERDAVEQSLAGFDLRPDLHRITAKTLVISGRDDGLNPPEAGEELASLIPDARFEVYEHSGHALAMEEPERLVADVVALVLGR